MFFFGFDFWVFRKSSMENRYGLYRQSSGLWRSLRDGDFEEEDVWAVLRNRTDNSTTSMGGKSKEASFSVPRPLPSATRMIPRATNSSSNSSSNRSSHEPKIVQQSAPMNIPYWSEISEKKSKKASKYDDDDGDSDEDDGFVNDDGDEDDEDEDEYNHKLPPHELISRRLARSQISSFSVFEGAGRTLKGRDLSKVRNAVLTKTGFLESP